VNISWIQISSKSAVRDEEEEEEEKKKKKFIVHRKTNNTNSDATTSTKVLCRTARIAETITAGRPTYIKFTQAVNETTPTNLTPRKPKTTRK